MKRLLMVVMALVLVAAFVEVALAQESGQMPGSMMQKKMMGHKAMMGDNMKRGMMMNKMMGQSLVATEDGGVVVMIGPKLFKYDKDLNLVKEAKIDIKKMHEEMKQMMKDCPECNQEQE